MVKKDSRKEIRVKNIKDCVTVSLAMPSVLV